MTNDPVRTRDAITNRLQVIVGLTHDLRRSFKAQAQTVSDLDGAVETVVRLLKQMPPNTPEDA